MGDRHARPPAERLQEPLRRLKRSRGERVVVIDEPRDLPLGDQELRVLLPERAMDLRNAPPLQDSQCLNERV